ncbi:hypothetical protein BX265_3922 [Streptomyces sp. TLI_235]|nr:hypothetical protein [Streptomyces sp. TLI_235]PBC79127.1 hypothetical protein BX265_3922 [Streptomyces sp. TLI_235]
MYLVHADLHPPAAGPPGDLPAGLGRAVAALALPNEGIEHVCVHAVPAAAPVIGVYVLADDLERAEEAAAGLCHRAAGLLPALAGWSVGRVGVPLVAPFYERMLAASDRGGRFGPRPLPSSRNPFHRA